VSDFLLNVVRRGAGLPPAVSPRPRVQHEEPRAEEKEPPALETEGAHGSVADRDEERAPAEPRASGAVGEHASPPRPAREPVSLAPVAHAPHPDATATMPGARRGPSSAVERPLSHVPTPPRSAPSTVPPATPSPVAAQAPVGVRPATAASAGKADGFPPARQAPPPASTSPPPDEVARTAVLTPLQPRESTSSRGSEPDVDLRPVHGSTLAAGRLRPATAPALEWPVAVPAPEAPRVDVRIGRIEILPAPLAVPPPSVPRRQPRGFAEETPARSYRDRRWY
jgi:hypothetical protein